MNTTVFYIFIIQLLYIPILAQNLPSTSLTTIPQQIGFAELEHQFTHITEENGLADNLVHCTLQDKSGFIWFGTHDGLSRWDGRSMKNFYPLDGDSTAISGSIIIDIVEDTEGYIWILTHRHGLTRYDPATQTFHSFPIYSKGIKTPTLAFCLLIDERSMIWVGTLGSGLLSFNTQIEQWQTTPIVGLTNTTTEIQRKNSILDIIQDHSNKNILWLGMANGLMQFNKKTGAKELFQSTWYSTQSTSVNALWMDEADHIWIATDGMGLVKFDIATAQWNYFPYDKEAFKSKTASNNQVFGLARKSPTELWVSTLHGSGVYNLVDSLFYFFDTTAEDLNSLKIKHVNNLYKSQKGQIWFMNHNAGVSFSDPSCQFFTFLPIPEVDCQDFGVPICHDFAEIPNTPIVYMAYTGCSGLIKWNYEQATFDKIPLKGFENQFSILKALLIDHNGLLWVGGNYASEIKDNYQLHGLWTYQEKQSHLSPFLVEHPLQEAINHSNISELLEDSQHNIWIGTESFNIYRISSNRKEIKKFTLASFEEQAISVYKIIEVNKQIWISTSKGVFYFDSPSQQFIPIPAFKNMDTKSIALDNEGLLWIATHAYGIKLLDPITKSIKTTSFWEDMPRTPIDNLIFDKKNQLWTSTENGIYFLDPTTNHFLNYSQKEGLKTPFFYKNGIISLQNGTILIGQQGGFYSFNPEQLIQSFEAKQLAFTELRVNEKNQVLHFKDGAIQPIQLPFDQNTLDISFSSLQYCQQKKILFTWKLNGVDKEWVIPYDNRHTARYTNLAPGHYSFDVKLAKQLNSKPIRFDITINPPFWKSWWAYLIYIFLCSSILVYLYKAQLKRQANKLETTRLKELNILKNRLYTNITHEFRTPLTVIQGMGQELPDSSKEKSLILRNTKQLLRMVNQMLDLSKLESSSMPTNNIQDDILPFLYYQAEAWSSYANTKQISLNFYTKMTELLMDFDPEKVEQILSNLLSNAIKFTPKYGKIQIVAEKNKQQLLLIIKDSGIGISKKKLPHVFNRFYQTDNSTTRKDEGTGIGLALVKELVQLLKGRIEVYSEERKGTTFCVYLPIENTADKVAFTAPPITHLSTPASDLIDLPTATKDLPILLIIEDNEDVIQYLKVCLHTQYQILMANDGKVGIQVAAANLPDIIISDVMMPEMDGFEVCQLLKGGITTSHIPIILLTAKAEQTDKIEGLSHGADAYLTKPFNKEELLVRLEQLIQIRRKIHTQFAKGLPVKATAELVLTPKDQKFIAQIISYIQEHIAEEDLEIVHLQRVVNLSRTQLYTKIKALTGMSPSQFKRSIRLQEGKKRLLQEPNLSVSEVAYQIGYKNASHFTRDFKQLFGITPTQLVVPK